MRTGSSCVVAPLRSRALLSVSGPDASRFIQGLCTNDVASADSAYTAFLGAKGRFLFDAFVLKQQDRQQQDGFKLEVLELAKQDFVRHLQRFKLRSKVEIQQNEDELVFGIAGPDPSEMQRTVEELQKWDANAFWDTRTSELGIRVHLQREKASEFMQWTQMKQFKTVPEHLMDLQLMFLGIPSAKRELIENKSFVLEHNLQWLNGVSFTKGCYLGQELVARTHFKGVIRKRVVPFIVGDQIPNIVKQLPLSRYIFPIEPNIIDAQEINVETEEAGKDILLGDDNLVVRDLDTRTEVGKVLSYSPGAGIALVMLRVEALWNQNNKFIMDTTSDERSSTAGEEVIKLPQGIQELPMHPYIPRWWQFNDR